MTAVPIERPLALAVRALLESTLGPGLVGYGVKPGGGGWQTTGTPTSSTPFKGYAVIYPGLTGPTDGPADAGSFDAYQGWQVTSVGSSAEQADAIRDRCRTALMSTPLAVTGRSLCPVELTDSQATQRDDDVAPPVYYAVDRFQAYSTPG